MILNRQGETEPFHARQLLGTSDERVLDCPPLASEILFGIRLLVRIQHLIDSRVADRVRGHAESHLVDRRDESVVLVGWDDGEPKEGAPLAVRFLIRHAHMAALEPPVHPCLDTPDSDEVIALVRWNSRGGNLLLEGHGVSRTEGRQEDRVAKRQPLLVTQLLDQLVIAEHVAAIGTGNPDINDAVGVQFLLGPQEIVDRYRRRRRE